MSKPFRLYAVFGCLPALLGQDFSHGTAIGIVRTNDLISVAVDSRAVAAAETKKGDVCKIRAAANYFFTIHGVGDEDLVDGIIRVLIGFGDISTKARQLRDRFTTTVVQRMRSAPDLKSSGVFVFGVESKILHLAYVQFLANAEVGAASSIIRECPGSDCIGGIITSSVSPYGDVLSRARSLDDVRDFVAEQINKGLQFERTHPGKTAWVGPPIQSLILHTDGSHEWRDKPPVCKDQP